MKKNIFFLIVSFFLFTFFIPSFVIAQTCPSYCEQMDTIQACADPNCNSCNLDCSPPGSADPIENMGDKITNKALPTLFLGITGTNYLTKILKTGISLVLIAGSVIFFFVLSSGGIKWLSSSGDKVKLESAQKQISSGLVGLAILLSSFAIIKLIETLFGIDLLNITLPTL